MKKKEKGKIVGIMLVLSLALVFMAAQSSSQVEKKQIGIEKLEDIENPDSEFMIDLWVDKEDSTYTIGDEIKFFFKTNKDCHLTLFNVGTDNKVAVLFPNEHHKENLVKADTVYSIPPEGATFIFKAQGPTGEDFVKAIATLADIPLYSEEEVKPAEGIQELQKTEDQTAKSIAIALKPVNKKKWAEAEKILKITEGD